MGIHLRVVSHEGGAGGADMEGLDKSPGKAWESPAWLPSPECISRWLWRVTRRGTSAFPFGRLFGVISYMRRLYWARALNSVRPGVLSAGRDLVLLCVGVAAEPQDSAP